MLRAFIGGVGSHLALSSARAGLRLEGSGVASKSDGSNFSLRQTIRVECALAVKCATGTEVSWRNGDTINISPQGMCIRAPWGPYRMGDEIAVWVQLPNGFKIVTRGVVRWLRDLDGKHVEIGLRLLDSPALWQAALKDLDPRRTPVVIPIHEETPPAM